MRRIIVAIPDLIKISSPGTLKDLHSSHVFNLGRYTVNNGFQSKPVCLLGERLLYLFPRGGERGEISRLEWGTLRLTNLNPYALPRRLYIVYHLSCSKARIS